MWKKPFLSQGRVHLEPYMPHPTRGSTWLICVMRQRTGYGLPSQTGHWALLRILMSLPTLPKPVLGFIKGGQIFCASFGHWRNYKRNKGSDFHLVDTRDISYPPYSALSPLPIPLGLSSQAATLRYLLSIVTKSTRKSKVSQWPAI